MCLRRQDAPISLRHRQSLHTSPPMNHSEYSLSRLSVPHVGRRSTGSAPLSWGLPRVERGWIRRSRRPPALKGNRQKARCRRHTCAQPPQTLGRCLVVSPDLPTSLVVGRRSLAPPTQWSLWVGGMNDTRPGNGCETHIDSSSGGGAGHEDRSSTLTGGLRA